MDSAQLSSENPPWFKAYCLWRSSGGPWGCPSHPRMSTQSLKLRYVTSYDIKNKRWTCLSVCQFSSDSVGRSLYLTHHYSLSGLLTLFILLIVGVRSRQNLKLLLDVSRTLITWENIRTDFIISLGEKNDQIFFFSYPEVTGDWGGHTTLFQRAALHYVKLQVTFRCDLFSFLLLLPWRPRQVFGDIFFVSEERTNWGKTPRRTASEGLF